MKKLLSLILVATTAIALAPSAEAGDHKSKCHKSSRGYVVIERPYYVPSSYYHRPEPRYYRSNSYYDESDSYYYRPSSSGYCSSRSYRETPRYSDHCDRSSRYYRSTPRVSFVFGF